MSGDLRLFVDRRNVATVELADTYWLRLRGLLGRRGIDGAMVFRPANAVHTLGMRFAIDVAHCDAEQRVLRTVTMAPHRLGRSVHGSKMVIEAYAGQFAQWGVVPGVTIEVRPIGPCDRAG